MHDQLIVGAGSAGGDTNAPAIMIGENAADLLLGRRAPREDAPAAGRE
jgi:hypothetical protein